MSAMNLLHFEPRRSIRRFVLAAALVACGAKLSAEEMPAAITRFLTTHCASCHGGAEPAAGLDLAKLPTDAAQLTVEATFARWVRIHDRVRAGEMPPPKEAPAPPVADRDAMLKSLSQTLTAVDSKRQAQAGRVALRRLNRSEYESTMRDLFDMPGLQVRDFLPEDGRYDGFDKASAALEISAVQLRKYLEAADFVLDEAIAHEARPQVFQARFRRIGGLAQFGEATFPLRAGKLDVEALEALRPKNGSPLRLPERMPYLERSDSLGILTHARPAYEPGVESFSPFHSGFYRIRTSVWSFDLKDREVQPTSRMQSLALTADGRLLAYFDAPSLAPRGHEIVVWLNAAESLQLNPANLWGNFQRPYGYEGPAVAVDYVDVEGPLHDMWPPASHRRLFGDLPLAELPYRRDGVYPRQPKRPMRHPGSRPSHKDGAEFNKNQPVWTVASPRPVQDAPRLLAEFLPRAFRRPVPQEEIDVFVRIAQERIAAGDFFEEALRAAYRVALCSPDFLFLHEPTGVAAPNDPPALDAYAVAARLSYFLWNSLPDDELRQVAEKNQLGGKSLLGQVDRLLADPRSDRFVADFLDQWLDLREIDFTSPERRLYPEFRNDLRDAMLAETRAYLREMLTENLGAAHVIGSDFAMVNQRLAEHYGIAGVEGSAIRRVPLPEGSPRGGLLTQASVLKVTANGTVTSPVIRGAWVMDRLLGRPPQPPPPNIPAVDPDVRGTTTIRAQLDKHRSEAVCARCHAQLDPPGFALESFDVIGRWRTQYRFVGDREIQDPAMQPGNDPAIGEFVGVLPKQWEHVRNNVRLGLPVDASGNTADGRAFRDVVELKRILLEDEVGLARNLVERLVLYSTGAPVGFADRAQVDRIVERSRKSRYGLRTLIDEIVQSPVFRRK